MATNFKIDKPIRLIELFAGYGSQAMALKRIGVEFEHYRVVEFDKFAIKSYNAVHGTEFMPMDIKKLHATDLGIVNTYLLTYLLTRFRAKIFQEQNQGKSLECQKILEHEAVCCGKLNDYYKKPLIRN